MTEADQKDEPKNYSETTDSVFNTTQKPQFRSRFRIKHWREYLGLTRDLSKSKRFQSVNKLLVYLKRGGRSNSYRDMICKEVYRLCLLTGKNPDELMQLSKKENGENVQNIVDRYLDSPNYARTKAYLLITFFKANGFKNENKLDIQLPKRLIMNAKTQPYVPSVEEANKMAECATSLRDRAIILTLISTGLRTSTLTAILFGKGSKDPNFERYTIKNELLNKRKNLMIAVYPEMKEINPKACKRNIPYYVFTSQKATEAIIDFISWRIDKYGSIPDDAPLFQTEYNQISPQKRNVTPLSAEEICQIVKKCAKLAGIKKWKIVRPKALRILFKEILEDQRPELRLAYDEEEFFMGHYRRPQISYFNRYRCQKLRAKFAKLDFKHSPVFNDEQQKHTNNHSSTIEDPVNSIYSQLFKKIEAIENAKQNLLFKSFSLETKTSDVSSVKSKFEEKPNQKTLEKSPKKNKKMKQTPKNLEDFLDEND